LIARLFNKKNVIILGGYDVTYIPSLKYGSFSNPIRKFCTNFSLKFSNHLLAVDRSLIWEAQARIKNSRGNFQEVPTGFDSRVWYPTCKKENLVLTVGICDSFQRLRLKGIDIFLDAAKLLPEYRFQVIGMKAGIKERIEIPDNVTTRDYVTFEELRDLYSKAKVYGQFSVREGLPSVVCEAMLCECIPVGTNNNGIPTAIGDCGFILEGRTAREAAKLIRIAMDSPQSLSKEARKRIKRNFTREQRKKSLFQLLPG
jgi:glycosyltransferase involved in cell wall biosynthesis